MVIIDFKKLIRSYLILSLLIIALKPASSWAMPPGTLLFRTSQDAKMYGYSGDELIEAKNGIVSNIYSGHVGIYIGRENGEDYVVEALGGGIVKTPAKYFVNRAEGETFLGGRLPQGVTSLQQAKVVALAKSLVAHKLGYDFDFKRQKGPGSGEWTCVGLTEKLYESANISNPNNLGALEYDPGYYAINITPDGFDNESLINKSGDCFSRSQEYSKIARRSDLLIPAPELIGFDLGLEHQGDRYIFLPYTQFIQSSLEPVAVDIPIASSFSGTEIRGAINTKLLILRWSLINNPISSLNRIASGLKDLSSLVLDKSKALIRSISQKISGSDNTEVLLNEDETARESGELTDETSKPQGTTSSPRVALVNKKKEISKVESKTNSQKLTVNNSKNNNLASKKLASTTPVKITKKSETKINSVSKNTPSKLATSSALSTSTTKIRPISKSPATISKSSSSSLTKVNPVSTAVTQANPAASSSGSANSGSGSDSSQSENIAWINKIYSTGDNYWLELYNPTEHDFDLAAAKYRLEKTKTAQDPSLIVRLGNVSDAAYPGGTIIKAHGRYLIVGSRANDFYKNKADALVMREDFSWSGSGYTIYLGNGAIDSSSDSNIIEAVGFGPEANYFEGAGPAPEIKDNYILSRTANSHNNNLDFNLIPSDDPEVKIASSPTSTNSTSSSGEIGTSTTASSSAATSSEQATSTEDNEEEEDSNSTGEVDWRRLALISKIYSTGTNDWLELFNASDHDLDLALEEYRLEKSKTASDPSLMLRFNNSEDALYPGGTIIKANSTYLIVRDEASAYYKSRADAIVLRDEFSWTGSGYTVYLANGPVSSSSDANIIDLVGFGAEASYFKGSGPAVAISDNYILNRIARTNNNNLDFNLIPSDDPAIASSSNSIDSSFLFIPPVTIKSDNLMNLWHFDECYGPGKWAVGRWDCAREVGYQCDNLVGTLSPAVNLNNFSVSFYYHNSFDYPQVNFRLFDTLGGQASLILEPNLVTVEGLPNSEWRYYMNIPFDDNWHQATLVVNQASDYWAVYIDGQEIIRASFLAQLSTITSFSVGGNRGSVLLDELAFWNRPLTPEEISSYHSAAAPFSPLINREPQKVAKLVNLWEFNEDAGIVAQDNFGNTELKVPGTVWTGRKHNNYAITTTYGQNFSANLKKPLKSPDLSLVLWWRNSNYPSGGKANIYLQGGANNEINLFSLLVDSYRLGFWFNGNYGVFAEGAGNGVPADNLWHHLALVYDSYRYKLTLYIDGEEKTSQPFIWIKADQELKNLLINTTGYDSEIDDLGLYEGALNPVQIKNIYLETR